jgi:chorismate mutase
VATAAVLCVFGPAVGTASADTPNPLTALVSAAAQRLQTADPVAAYKFVTRGSIEDAPREKAVLDAVGKDAVAQHVDPDYVREVFRDQIDATNAVEYGRFAEWKLDTSGAPVTAPELSASRTAIDALNSTMVDEIAAQWDALHAPDCAANLAAAIDAATAKRDPDDLFGAALDFATHRYCRS